MNVYRFRRGYAFSAMVVLRLKMQTVLCKKPNHSALTTKTVWIVRAHNQTHTHTQNAYGI